MTAPDSGLPLTVPVPLIWNVHWAHHSVVRKVVSTPSFSQVWVGYTTVEDWLNPASQRSKACSSTRWSSVSGPAVAVSGDALATGDPPMELGVAAPLAAAPALGVDGEPHPAAINTTKPPRKAAKS